MTATSLSRTNSANPELWRRVGTRLPTGGSTEDVLRSAEFYAVEEKRLTVWPDHLPVNDRKALVRADTGRYLATVGKKYQPIQFTDVFRTVVDAGSDLGVKFLAAGTFGLNGVRAWMLAELPHEIVVRGDESPMKKYLLAVAGHDGKTSVLLKNTALRIWCSNAIGAAMRALGGLWRIHHTASAPQRLAEASRGFRQIHESFLRLGDLANRLAVTRLATKQMDQVSEKLLPVLDDGLDHSRVLEGREKLRDLFENGVGITSSIRGTGWAAVNAVTEYFDHHRSIRAGKGGDVQRRRLESMWLGSSASKKEEALALIMAQAGLSRAVA
jgi:phage/plasmid-like protein (TIGR03299 family)